jgi:hypothetical protein
MHASNAGSQAVQVPLGVPLTQVSQRSARQLDWHDPLWHVLHVVASQATQFPPPTPQVVLVPVATHVPLAALPLLQQVLPVQVQVMVPPHPSDKDPHWSERLASLHVFGTQQAVFEQVPS